MMRYTSLKRRPRHFHSFTGLKVEEFDKLVQEISGDWERQRRERLTKNNPHRKRKLGGGRKKVLSTLQDQLLLTLAWARTYPSYLVLEYLFGIDESSVCRTIQESLPLLQDRFVLQDPRKSARKKITTLEELQKLLPEDIRIEEIIGDATEQAIPRPEKKRKRTTHHSGKKKRFTLKTQIATNQEGYILHTSRASPGRVHDYKLFKNSPLPSLVPQDTPCYLDSGYQGVHKDFPDLQACIPFKRTRSHRELTRSEKIQNTKQRRVRVVVEHTISRLKKYQVLAQTYRHALHKYTPTFRFVANIVNFRMLCRVPALV